jgi:hypothetical protein
VSDAEEAVGDHVEQETAEELLGVELHDLHAIAIGVVAPAEANATGGQAAGRRDTGRRRPSPGRGPERGNPAARESSASRRARARRRSRRSARGHAA